MEKTSLRSQGLSSSSQPAVIYKSPHAPNPLEMFYSLQTEPRGLDGLDICRGLQLQHFMMLLFQEKDTLSPFPCVLRAGSHTVISSIMPGESLKRGRSSLVDKVQGE